MPSIASLNSPGGATSATDISLTLALITNGNGTSNTIFAGGNCLKNNEATYLGQDVEPGCWDESWLSGGYGGSGRKQCGRTGWPGRQRGRYLGWAVSKRCLVCDV
jgi:hypothetical protein